MTPLTAERIKEVKDFDALIELLRDELDWPLQADDIDDLSFDYDPEEIGLTDEVAVKVNYIKQLRPLAHNQPWGIFYIDFEPKKLPVVVLRRILQKLVIKKRVSIKSGDHQMWHQNDLLFINSFGIQEDREMTFAHFSQEDESALPTLKVIGWDGQDTPLKLDRCIDDLQHLRFDPELDPDQWRTQWSAAFRSSLYQSIKTSKALAQILAKLAQDIRTNASSILKYEKKNGPFHKMMAKFKQALIHDLTEDDFSDMYAQTIAYGLLYTAIRSHTTGEANRVSAEQVQQLVLPTNPFLKEVMEDFFNIGTRKWDSDKEMITGIDFDELGINEIISTLKDEKTDFDAILRDFGNKNPNEDPVIHFYELFLKEYDAFKRKGRGVYYTPQPVVNFIVRSVHEVLKKDFGLEYGLADISTWAQMIEKNPDIKLPSGVSKDDFFVQILDPATGTGTFLVETIDLIHKTMVQQWQKHGATKEDIEKQWNKYVPEKLMPRLYGFELMMAPYAIAHMKIGIKLYETGYRFEDQSQRVQVYLTNTLEEPVDPDGYLDTLDPAMAEETREANEIKQTNSVTVVIGNPPYAGHSFNNGQWIYSLLRTKLADGADSYFKVDGANLGEKTSKWLNDDYVKFIRYSQSKLSNTGSGVFGFITNHGYIDNPTFRGMRQSLMNTYNQINLIDLHGNAKKKEKCPDGSKDENVFEIQQGVAINIAAKLPAKTQNYNHNHLWGTRDTKFLLCRNNTAFSFEEATKLSPVSDMYLFCPQDTDLLNEYKPGVPITEIIPLNGTGVITKRDFLSINIDRGILWDTVTKFARLSESETRRCFQLPEDVRDWRYEWAKKDIIDSGPSRKCIRQILYRPFDYQHIYYTGRSRGFIGWPVTRLMNHMLAGENLGLMTCRQRSQKEGLWASVGISNIMIESCAISNKTKEVNYLFPLYLYPQNNRGKGQTTFDTNTSGWSKGKNGRTPNLDPKFVQQFSQAVTLDFVSDGKGDLKKTYGPEDLLAYIYAVFHSPTYRTRYAEFLKYDFPRVPITSDTDMFRKLVKLGAELMALHLMESDKLDNHITSFPIEGDNAVIKVGETGKKLAEVSNGQGRLYINKTQYFDNLPEEVFSFHIGGYQVCHKWLADRKKAKRKLSADDITHYHRIVVVLNETIKQMAKIDETIDSHTTWPIK